MMGWLIALAVIVLLAILPLGVSLIYDESGPGAWILAGPARIRVYPANRKKPPKKPDRQKAPEPSAQKTPAKPAQPGGGRWKDFLPLVRVGLDFLGDLRRRLRVRNLELELQMAGDDPCDLAINYGRANAAMGNLLALLSRTFVIQKQQVRIGCDFDANEMTVRARLDLTLTLGRALFLLGKYGVRGLRTYLNLSKKRKGGANL